jgi:predicted kinase
MNKKTMLVLIGLPGSGKTEYAHRLMTNSPNQYFRISWDDLRKADPNWKFSYEAEYKMKSASYALAEQAAAENLSLIIDNTNLSPVTRERWRNLAKKLGLEYQEYEMNMPQWVCVHRDQGREIGNGRVGQAVIDRMALFAGRVSFDHRPMIIVDMDGTLANCEHRKHFIDVNCYFCNGEGVVPSVFDPLGLTCPVCLGAPKKKKDWDGFYRADLIAQDPVVEPIRMLVDKMSQDHLVVIVSGRPVDKAGIATEDWLRKHKIRYEYLFMRNSGDHRPDNLVKKEILDRLPKDKISFVLDDRDQVVKMWRDNGLTCLQVAPGNF